MPAPDPTVPHAHPTAARARRLLAAAGLALASLTGVACAGDASAPTAPPTTTPTTPATPATPTTPASTHTLPFRLGGAGIDYGKDLVVDRAGNLYVAGYFSNAIDVDPGAGTTTLTSAGGVDVFVAKYDPTGALLWARRFGGPSLEIPHSVQVDASGAVYVAGYFSASVAFDAVTLTSAGARDVFVARLSPAGVVEWATGFGSAGDDEAMDLAVDEAGRAYAAGFLTGTADVDPGPARRELAAADTTGDAFLVAYDAAGRVRWAARTGGTGRDYGNAVRVRGTAVWLAGFFGGTAQVGTATDAAGATLTSRGGGDAYLARYDADGGVAWARAFGGPGNDQVRPGGMALDATGAVYLTGDFTGTTDFDLGAGQTTRTSRGGGDVFVVSHDAAGAFRWVATMGGPGLDGGHRLAVGPAGDAYVTGWFAGALTADGGRTLTGHGTGGASDVLVARLDPAGQTLWVQGFGGVVAGADNFQIGGGLGIDPQGGVVITGRFYGTPDVDPGPGTATLASAGQSDAFVVRYSAAGALVGAR